MSGNRLNNRSVFIRMASTGSLPEKAGNRYLVMNTIKEALQNAPSYVFDKTKGVWVPATKQPR